MITDKSTIKTMNNKVANKMCTVSAMQSKRDEIADQVQAFIDAGGKIEQVDSYQCNQPGVVMSGANGLSGMMGYKVNNNLQA